MEKAILVLTSLFYILLTSGCIYSSGVEKPTSMINENIVKEDNDEKQCALYNTTSSIGLHVYRTPMKYSYDDLGQDINKLQSIYGEKLIVRSICETADGRSVYDIILGQPDGAKQILILGAMHAREYITTQVVMRQLCDAIDAQNGYGKSYQGITLNKLMEDVTIHFIPMINPDGVAISQDGVEAIHNLAIRDQIINMGECDYEQWKANGMGVDLNRNFDAGWIEYTGSISSAPERYKGKFPGSEPESAALIKLTEKYNICRTISYHTCGALIYWYYKQNGSILEQSQIFAKRISQETGYPLDSDYTAVDAAGYKDWAVYRKGIPSLTIEVGAEDGNSIVNPVPISRWDTIWARNKNVLYATIFDLKNE